MQRRSSAMPTPSSSTRWRSFCVAASPASSFRSWKRWMLHPKSVDMSFERESPLTPAGACRQTALIMVWFDLVLSRAKESTYSCRCVQTDSFNHGLVWFCPVMKSPLTPSGVCRQTALIMVWFGLVLSCAKESTYSCRCVQTDSFNHGLVWFGSILCQRAYLLLQVCADRQL